MFITGLISVFLIVLKMNIAMKSSETSDAVCVCLIFLVWMAVRTSQPNRPALGDNQRSDTWRVIGPGGGGGVLKPTISPFDEKLVMTHCDMTAAYLSRDGGENWKMKNLWTVPEDFEFDPVDPIHHLCCHQGLPSQ